ncbi:MAG: hypothetical protein IT450_18075 [Phycisphaerales bacterium]|nr:hypothetical protein [Phycisphaerales bacterium]
MNAREQAVLETPLFPLGNIQATPGAIRLMAESGVTVPELLARHAAGDWGDELDDEDKRANDNAIIECTRVLSRYRCGEGSLYVITEHDRSYTTILQPCEY